MAYSPSTEPLFLGTTNINTVNLSLTTLCTMHCPNCSYSMPQMRAAKVARHATVEEIVRDSKHMKGLRRVHLTGGEATMHPEFEQIALNVREWFECQLVSIETNGTLYKRFRSLFRDPKVFDRVFVTHYIKDAIYKGNFDSGEAIKLAEEDCGERLLRDDPVEHTSYHRLLPSTSSAPCRKWYNPGLPAGWSNGLLYPCCVTFGIDASVGIPVTPNWREELQKVSMCCDRCLFQGT